MMLPVSMIAANELAGEPDILPIRVISRHIIAVLALTRKRTFGVYWRNSKGTCLVGFRRARTAAAILTASSMSPRFRLAAAASLR